MRVAAAPLGSGFAKGAKAADLEIVLYGHADVPHRSGVGVHIPDIIHKLKLRPAKRAWDFLSLALAVEATDMCVVRDKSPDGWTREIDLLVSVIEPEFWNSQRGLINSFLRFLTTDIWNVTFQTGGLHPPPPKGPVYPTEDCVSLLSGGLDSLVGAIDLVHKKKKVYFASQVATGDKTNQKDFASKLGQQLLQLNHVATSPEPAERSQRARSIIFLAYAVLLATTFFRYQKGEAVPLYVCENGLISINPPLTPMRLGSLSTRTTHPVYLRGVQSLLENAALAVEISNPYQFKTKGQMLKQCLDQDLLKKLASKSTSCGRYARNGFQHCGRCVPCIIRRAAFHGWGETDQTSYKYKKLAKDDSKHAGFDDVRALGMASQIYKSPEFVANVEAVLASPLVPDSAPYKDIVNRGMKEVQDFLNAAGVK